MLIEALAALAEKTGAERISLEIPPSSGGNCAVMVVTSLGHNARVSDDEKDGKLLAALAAPLVVEGNVGELDSRLVSLIDDLESDFEEASKGLPETDAQKRRRELKEAAAKKDKKGEVAKKTTSKKTAEKDASKAEADDEGEAEHEEALASGEADSL